MSQVERIEGRRHALSLIQSVAGMPRAMIEQDDVVSNLRQAITQRAGSDWAKGVEEILELLP